MIPKPKWWQPFLLMPLMIALYFLDGQIKFPAQLHPLIEIGIVLIIFGLMALWVHVNQFALFNEELEHTDRLYSIQVCDPEPRQVGMLSSALWFAKVKTDFAEVDPHPLEERYN